MCTLSGLGSAGFGVKGLGFKAGFGAYVVGFKNSGFSALDFLCLDLAPKLSLSWA